MQLRMTRTFNFFEKYLRAIRAKLQTRLIFSKSNALAHILHSLMIYVYADT